MTRMGDGIAAAAASLTAKYARSEQIVGLTLARGHVNAAPRPPALAEKTNPARCYPVGFKKRFLTRRVRVANSGTVCVI
jgi:hypothetical protein